MFADGTYWAVSSTSIEPRPEFLDPTASPRRPWRATSTWPGCSWRRGPRVPGLGLEELTPSEVIQFVLSECRHRSTGSAKYVVAGLRALLRYCYLEGRTARPLADVVPSVAGWRLAALPRAVDRADVAALLKSCDRRSTFGRRDFAVLIL